MHIAMTQSPRDAHSDDSIPESLSFRDFVVFRQNVRPLGGSISKMLTENAEGLVNVELELLEIDGRMEDRLADELVREANLLAMGFTIEGDSCSGTKRKCGHEHSRNISLDMYVQRHGRIPITNDEMVGKPISVFATKFCNAIGTATQDTILVCCSKWKDGFSDVISTIKAHQQTHFVVGMSSIVIHKLLNKEDWEVLCGR
ncbi:CACTA en-spm transposon protein [Cucumis melo var. makuwa]|uniref:CACTA en-spm transposon protein n=1 Tax=Cucumis melo var. makuwa TaxID=1194695 RepID=A0A5A7T4S0_CUCMM|nr:CACTA en-spm transposon protein [Cucumis melo var. makuwa]